jgi:hypothetical protein
MVIDPSFNILQSGTKGGTYKYTIWVRVMVFNATINNISAMSWLSVLLVDETRVPEEKKNHWPVTSNWQTLSHNVVWSTPRHEQGLNSQR